MMARKTRWRPALLGAAVALSAGIASAGVGDLAYMKSPPMSFQGTILRSLKAIPPEQRVAAGLVSPKAVLLKSTGAIRIAVDAGAADAETLDLVRIDTTGTGNFRDARTLKLKIQTRSTSYTRGSFGPETVQIPRNGKTIPVRVFGHYYGRAQRVYGGASLTVAAEGSCAFARTQRKVRVVDGSGNLALGDPAKPPFSRSTARPKADMVFVADENGNFTGPRSTPTYLGQPIEVGGAWYVVSAEDMKVSAAPLEGGTGEVSVDAARWQCTLAGEKYLLTVRGGKEPVRVPPDRYRIQQYRLYAEEATDRRVAMIYGYRGTKALDVAAAKATRLPIGSPIQAKILTRQASGRVIFSLAQTDGAGARIGGVIAEGGKRPPKPKIDVVGKEGKVVYTANLEYG